MKENADKYLDDLSRKVIGKSNLEKPSMEFTSNVMSQIKAMAASTRIHYKPLISKPVWFLIGLLSISAVGYILFGPKSKSEWIPKLSLDEYFNMSSLIPELNISQTTFYVLVLFAIMLCIQMIFLKRQLHKPFDDV